MNKKSEYKSTSLYLNESLIKRVKDWKESQPFDPSFSQAIEFLVACALDKLEEENK